MADNEVEILRLQISQIQQTLERQADARQRLGLFTSLLAIFLAVAAMGFIVAGIWLDAKSSPSAHQFTQIMGYQFLFSSLPLIMLTLALRSH